MVTTRRLAAAFAVCLGLSGASAARAGDGGREVVAQLGKLAVSAAHPTGQDVALLKHDTRERGGRLTVTAKMEYYGAWSGRRYLAEVEFEFVTAGRPACLSIKYSDNNPIPEASGWKEKMRQALNDALDGKK
jgi:hypothetical protein